MIMKRIFTIALVLMALHSNAQNPSVPYREIPDYPDKYTAGTATARMIDGLGFRFYWATDGLSQKDLDYRPSDMARSSEETVDHVYNLAKIVMLTAMKLPFEGRSA